MAVSGFPEFELQRVAESEIYAVICGLGNWSTKTYSCFPELFMFLTLVYLQILKNTVKLWGGHLYVIFLTMASRYSYYNGRVCYNEAYLELASNLGFLRKNDVSFFIKSKICKFVVICFLWVRLGRILHFEESISGEKFCCISNVLFPTHYSVKSPSFSSGLLIGLEDLAWCSLKNTMISWNFRWL